jgi:acetyl-CoA carboxylase alpha subunit
VTSPLPRLTAAEAAGAILARDPGLRPEVADRLRLTARELLGLGITDEVIPNTCAGVVDLVRDHVLAAFESTRAGNRTIRANTATSAWLRVASQPIDLAGWEAHP